MMVKPSVTELLKLIDNRYSLVVAAAKRARQIESGSTILTTKNDKVSVTIAVNEIAEGKVKIVVC